VLKKYMQLQVPLPVKFSERQTINYQLSGAKTTIVSGDYSNTNLSNALIFDVLRFEKLGK
jgi:hypothetical protein